MEIFDFFQRHENSVHVLSSFSLPFNLQSCDWPLEVKIRRIFLILFRKCGEAPLRGF